MSLTGISFLLAGMLFLLLVSTTLLVSVDNHLREMRKGQKKIIELLEKIAK